MRVVIAPDSFGGTLSSSQAAEAIAAGWNRQRPGDDIELVPLADGGEGTLEVVASAQGGELHHVEVADPLGRPIIARWLRCDDGPALVESADACGLALLDEHERDPLKTTTYGVGQLLEAVHQEGVERIAIGLGGSATVDGGAGAAMALGLRVKRDDGNGVKIGGGQLVDVDHVQPGWLDDGWPDRDVALWADVNTVLGRAAASFGPQKGAGEQTVRRLAEGLDRWARVLERDLDGAWRELPGSGAAGGLGFGLVGVLNATLVSGAEAVADLTGLDTALSGADLVMTGEGRLDATSLEGKVVGEVAGRAAVAGLDVVAVVGRMDERESDGVSRHDPAARLDALKTVEEAAPTGPGDDPAGEVARAAERLATRLG